MTKRIRALGIAFVLSTVGWVANAAVALEAAANSDEAARYAQNKTGGRVLSVEWAEAESGPVYKVKVLLPDGSVTVEPVPATKNN